MNGRLPSGPRVDNRSSHTPHPPPAPELPLVLDPKVVEAALANATAAPLTDHVTSLVLFRGVWWLDDGDAWLRITDDAFAAHLIDVHRRRQ